MVITTKCIVHDAAQVKQYQQMGISESPEKLRRFCQFHMGDVKRLAQHFMEDGDTEQEVTLVYFYDGEVMPVTETFEDLAKKYQEFNDRTDDLIREKLELKKQKLD